MAAVGVRLIVLEKQGMGFGFSIVGGAPSPVLVSKITPGTPAAACTELHAGDQIMEIDGQDVQKLNNFQIVALIKQAKERISITLKSTLVDVEAVTKSATDKDRRLKEEAERRGNKATLSPQPPRKVEPAVSPQPARKAEVAASPAHAHHAPGPAVGARPAHAPAPAPAPAPAVAPTPAPQAAAAEVAANRVAASEAVAAAHAALATASPAEAQALGAVIGRLEGVLAAIEAQYGSGDAAGAAGAEAGSGDGEHPSIVAYDQLLSGAVAKLVEHATAIGGDAAEITKLLQAAFVAQRELMSVVPLTQKPGDKVAEQILDGTVDALKAIAAFKESHGKTTAPNHVAAVAEAASMLSWTSVTPTPASFVKDMLECSAFYTNRVMKDGGAHADWAKALIAAGEELRDFVKKHHTTGLAWGKKIRGAAWWANAVAKTAPGSTPPDKFKFNTALNGPVVSEPGVGSLPEPEALKPQRPLNPIAKAVLLGRSDIPQASLLGELADKGEGVTSGLRHVPKDQMTHKNPELRASSVVPASAAAPAAAAPSRAAGPAVQKPPVLELSGKKWLVEYQKDNKNIVIEAEPKHTVYISRCTNSTIQIKGKVNSIMCDGCVKTAVVFDSVLAAFEFVNCKSMQLQVLGHVPTISIDKTDGCQVYLGEASLSADIISAKSSEMNVLVPGADGDFLEMAVPEQYKSMWNGRKLVTTTHDLNL